MRKPCTDCEYKILKNTYCDYHKYCDKYKKYEEYLESKRQYTEGKQIKNFGILEQCLERDSFVFMRHKIYHAGWIESLQYHTIDVALKKGYFYEAIKKGNENKNITILVDIDDTIEDLLGAWCKWLNEHYQTGVDVKDVSDWDMHLAFPTLTTDQIYEPLCMEEFWETVQPREDAMVYLKQLYDSGYSIYLCTSTSYENVKPKYETIIQKYFPYIDWDHIIITSNKTMLKGDIMIDDGVHNLLGGDYLKILMSSPHNMWFDADKYEVSRVYKWCEIIAIINTYKKNRNKL